VTVNGTPAVVEADGTYIAEGLNLPPGPNTLTASGEKPSTHETGTHSVNMTKLAAQNVSYAYDARGNMTSRTDATGTSRYDWDPMNRLRSITFPDGMRHQYFYDGLGRRLKSIENGVERRFVYDGWNVIGEKRAGSDDFVSYYTRGADLGGGIGGIISVHRNGTPQIYPDGYQTGDYFYHYNHRGDVVSVTNSSGNEVAEYWYDAFGNMVRKTGTFDSPYRFSTKEYDAASGLSYFGFRYYSPPQGIWLSKDPLDYINGPNLYSFVTNNPVNGIDPSGLWLIAIEGYYGWGGGFIVGRNPGGNYFLSFRFGYGIGGGISYEPRGTSPGWTLCGDQQPLSFSIGAFGNANAGLGLAFTGMQGQTGAKYEDQRYNPYVGVDLAYGLDLGWVLRVGAAVGVEITWY